MGRRRNQRMKEKGKEGSEKERLDDDEIHVYENLQ